MRNVVGVRFEDSERELVFGAAKRQGKTPSEYIREAALSRARAAAAGREAASDAEDARFDPRLAAEEVAEELAARLRADGFDVDVTAAQAWFTITLKGTRRAPVIVRSGMDYLRPLFTLAGARYDEERRHWPNWMRDTSSHVLRGGPTFRERGHLSQSQDRLRVLALEAAKSAAQ